MEIRAAALRRIAIGGAGLASASAISSILFPTAAQAASPTPLGTVTVTNELNAQRSPSGQNASGSWPATERENLLLTEVVR